MPESSAAARAASAMRPTGSRACSGLTSRWTHWPTPTTTIWSRSFIDFPVDAHAGANACVDRSMEADARRRGAGRCGKSEWSAKAAQALRGLCLRRLKNRRVPLLLGFLRGSNGLDGDEGLEIVDARQAPHGEGERD